MVLSWGRNKRQWWTNWTIPLASSVAGRGISFRCSFSLIPQLRDIEFHQPFPINGIRAGGFWLGTRNLCLDRMSIRCYSEKGSSQRWLFLLPKPDDFCQPSVLICKPLKVKSESEVTQSCPTLCDPVDCSLPGFSIHGILQARILEWVTISFSRGSFWPRDWTCISCIFCTGRWFSTSVPPGKPYKDRDSKVRQSIGT